MNFDPLGLTSDMNSALFVTGGLVTSSPSGLSWFTIKKGGTWSPVQAMTYLNDYVYLVHGDTLYKIAPGDGTVDKTYPGWPGTQALFAARGWIYLFINDCLYRINPVSLTNAPTSTMNGPGCWT